MRKCQMPIFFLAATLLLCGLPADCLAQEYHKSITQLTFHPDIDYYPSWSPDGKYIAFSSSRAGGHIWKVPAAGGTAIQVTQINANHPSWSPEGSYIAFDSDQGSIVRIVPQDGGVPVKIVPDSIKIGRGAHPCWSRDGTKVTFTAEGDIWTVDLPTGKLNRIFHQDGFWARAFSWSPDGKYISADVGGADKSDDDVWLLPVDSGEPIVLTDFPGREGNPKFSPDGSMIVFMLDEHGKKELRIMFAEGGKSITITTHEGFNANPCWSPDSQKIAFASDMNGNPDIYVMELNLKLIRVALEIKE